MSSLIRLDAVCKSYPTHQVQALKSISLEVTQGERLALMGASGSGKTTLLNIIGLIDTFDSGAFFLNDISVSELSEVQRTELRREKIGFIFQFFNLLPTLTVFENIALPLLLKGGLTNTQIEKQVNSLIDLVNLGERTLFFPHQLSGGQMQRVAIARALIHRPLLLIADEPTGNLDSETGQEILTLLANSCQEYGQTLVMATHSPDAAALCGRIAKIQDGRLLTL